MLPEVLARNTNPLEVAQTTTCHSFPLLCSWTEKAPEELLHLGLCLRTQQTALLSPLQGRGQKQ